MTIIESPRLTPILAMLLTLVAARSHAAEHHTSSSSSYGFSSSWNWSSGGDQTAVRQHQARGGSRNVPAPSYGIWRTSRGGSVNVRNLPLLAGLNVANQVGSANVLVGASAAKVLRDSNKSLTLHASYDSQEQLLRIILQGLDVRVTNDQGRLIVLAGDDTAADEDLTPASRLATEAALRRNVTLHLDHVPLPMAIQMLEGFAGVRIIDDFNGGRWAIVEPTLTIHADARPVSEVLGAIARQIDGEFRVADDRLELVRRTTGRSENR